MIQNHFLKDWQVRNLNDYFNCFIAIAIINSPFLEVQNKKDQEFQDSIRQGSRPRPIDDDDAEFLNEADQALREREKRIKLEEEAQLKAFKIDHVSNSVTTAEPIGTNQTTAAAPLSNQIKTKVSSQKHILALAVKKRTEKEVESIKKSVTAAPVKNALVDYPDSD